MSKKTFQIIFSITVLLFIVSFSYINNGAPIAGATDNNLGGWDGWIKLSGNVIGGGTYGARVTGKLFSGYSFGSDVIGWLSWKGAEYGGYGVVSDTVLADQAPTAYIDSPVPPSVDISTIYPTTPIAFSGHGTDPEDGSTNIYNWHESNNCSGATYSTAANFNKTYPTAGNYYMSLIVTDSQGAASNCASVSIIRAYAFTENGTCGSANGVSTSKPPTSGLCSTGAPNPSTLSGNGPWSWDCEDQYGTTAHCSAANSCGPSAPQGDRGVCQHDKGETPANCRADCPLNFREF